MPVPVGLQRDLAAYLEDVEARLAALEAPQGFTPGFLTTSTNLTTASAAAFGSRWAFVTDLHTAAFSNGSHWYRTDTGAQIV